MILSINLSRLKMTKSDVISLAFKVYTIDSAPNSLLYNIGFPDLSSI